MQTSKVGNELYQNVATSDSSRRASLIQSPASDMKDLRYHTVLTIYPWNYLRNPSEISRNAKYSHVRGQSSNATFLLLVEVATNPASRTLVISA